MTTAPEGAITYEQWLLYRIANPGVTCGPDVIDTRSWWQYLPGLNPYADLKQRARAAERNWAASTRVSGDRTLAAEREAELEAG